MVEEFKDECQSLPQGLRCGYCKAMERQKVKEAKVIDFEEIVKSRTPQQNEEITDHVIKNESYKGWVSSYLGDGRLVFSKSNEQDIKAYRGRECIDWILETWIECKAKIDSNDPLN